MKTAVVILNWNGSDFLGRFLPGLVASLKGYDARVIVADNASTDGSLALLNERFPEVGVLCFNENYGFTGGYNKAFEEICGNGAREADRPEYFLLINSDVEVEGDWLYPLEEWMDLHADCGMCAPKLHSFSRRVRFEYAGAAGGWLDRFGYPFCRGRVMDMTEEDEGQYDIPAEVMWATGACLMVRSSVWKELGGLDGRFFAHMEEIDLCWRARLMGYKVCIVPRSTVRHVGGGTLPQGSPWKAKLNHRNNLLMLDNNLAATIALRNFYDLLATTAPEVEVSTDEFLNCFEALEDYPEALQDKVIEASVDDAVARARAKIRTRMVLDGISAVIYALQGKKGFFKAVVEAHKEYRSLRHGADKQELRALIEREIRENAPAGRAMLDIDLDRRRADRVRVKGMADLSIVLRAKLLREDIFVHLDDELEWNK